MFVFTSIAGALLIMYALSLALNHFYLNGGSIRFLETMARGLPSEIVTSAFFIKISLFVGIPMLIIVLATQLQSAELILLQKL